MIIPMPDATQRRVTARRFPGYDVLSKRWSPSWNEKTREVVTSRLAIGGDPKFFTEEEFQTVVAIAARIVPQPADRQPIPVAALVDDKLHLNKQDGYRLANIPREQEAWRRGLKALDEEARQAFGSGFRELRSQDQDELITRMQGGDLKAAAWGGMDPKNFFKLRMARDIVFAYYAHPTAWSEIGWGGPASPRGYVRMDFNKRDPWEAAEVKGGDVEAALRKNRRV
jgi:hypothetical protein